MLSRKIINIYNDIAQKYVTVKHSKVFTIIEKRPILNMWLNSEFDCSIDNRTDIKERAPHRFLKFYKFYRIVFHFFFEIVFFSFRDSDLRFFPAYMLFWWMSRGLQSKELLNFLRHKHNIWKVIKYDLVLKMLYHQPYHIMALCRDNGGMWRFLLSYSITVHHKKQKNE